jgi:hypothetical protein
MSERRDNTTDTTQDEPTNKRARAPGAYYYDDATGYEVYDPAQEQDEADQDSATEDGAGG